MNAGPVATKGQTFGADATLSRASPRSSAPLPPSTDEGSTMSTVDTAADWDAFIASAPTLIEAMERLERAVNTGVDMPALLALQAERSTA